ncbi:MAG TPA: methyltransferase domain-containing protein, partial [Longimicrobiales bacterium]|nr:methyltransferase domain-containing protein [Longimicrobiales bacterium]
MPVYSLTACPACTGNAADVLADEAAIRAELELLWMFHLARRVERVPTRQLFDRAYFSQHPPLRLARCRACGTVYRDPGERADALLETYRNETLTDELLGPLYVAQRASYRRQAKRLTSVAGGPGVGLEVGSYVGAFLHAAAQIGWRFAGVDVNEPANAFASRQGFDVQLGRLEDVSPNVTLDAIAFWNCFDQLADPRATLRAARERLRKGGVIAIRVPNGDCYARFCAAARNGHRLALLVLAYNNLLGFPYRQGFNPRSLG